MKHLRRLAVTGVLCLLATCAVADSKLNRTNGNPLIPGYFADPCIRKFGDTYYLYATPDGWGIGEGRACTWTSKDFVNWTPHLSNWPTTREKWAPSVVYANGKYYMYTQVPCQIWVGVSDSPLGPWKNPLGDRPLVDNQVPKGTITLDGEVFIDDDGQGYLMYGTWWTPTIMRLNKDLISWTSEPIQYFKRDNNKTPNGLIKGCMEAPYMLKRDGLYYLMYSDMFCGNSTYQVKYSTSTSPLGPWTYGENNPILATNTDNSVDGPGHHSMLKEKDLDIMVYHRHDNPHHVDGSHRQVCADFMKFGPKGTILPMTPSEHGIGYLAPSTVRDTNWVVDPSSHVTATASSSMGPDFGPEQAADANNGTLWKAKTAQYPQWLQIDLGKPRSVKRVETDFQHPQLGYRYKVESSMDGQHWDTFVDRTAPSEWKPAVDSVQTAKTARYFKVTIVGDDAPEMPIKEIGIWNVKLYDGVPKPLVAPVVQVPKEKSCYVDAPRVQLEGVVQNGGLPTQARWIKRSGPGTVSFTDANEADTVATFSAAGRYELELSGQNQKGKAAGVVVVNVKTPDRSVLVDYDFNEKRDSRVIDHSGSQQDGLLASDGDVKNNPSRVTGLFGDGLVLDGLKGYVSIPGLGSRSTLSMGMWVKFDELDHAGVLSSADGSVRLSLRNSGQFQLYVKGNSPELITSDLGDQPNLIGRWHYLAFSYDEKQKRVRFSIDGKLGAWQEYTVAGPLTLTSGVRIGSAGTEHLAGKIDSLKLFRNSLEDAELKSLATAPHLAEVSDVLQLPVGSAVDLRGLSVTFAPRDENDVRTTNWFYVADSTGKMQTILVKGRGDSAREDWGVTLRGTLQKDASGTPYIELTDTPETESAPVLAPNNVGSINDAKTKQMSGTPILIKAVVKSVAQDRKAMTLSDEHGDQLVVQIEGEALARIIGVGNTVEVLGVMSGTDLHARSVRRLLPAIPPLEDGLLAHFKFDEKQGTVATDDSESGLTATVKGASWQAGKVGGGVVLDGTSGDVTLPNMGTHRAITIAGWVSPHVFRDWQAIFHTDQFEPNRKLHLSVHQDGGLLLSVSGNTPVDFRTRPAFDVHSPNVWRHIALTYDAKTRSAKIYVDGELLADFKYALANSISLSDGLRLGSWGGGSRYFDGGLDDFRFYGRALSGSEIKLLISSGAKPLASKD